MIDRQRFMQACDKVVNIERERVGIGTLGEKTLHAILKHYYEPDPLRHEIKVSRYVADILTDTGIIEIQTASFDKLRQKLSAFLVDTPVTVVFPIARTKWIQWIDANTGEVTTKRKSPKKGTPNQIFYELYKIKFLLSHQNLKIHILLLDIEEFRNLDGWSDDRKKGSSRYERIPIDIVEEVLLDTIKDYYQLIPAMLTLPFTVKDYKKATGLSLGTAQKAMNVLKFIQVVEQIGKKGRAYLYAKTQQLPD